MRKTLSISLLIVAALLSAQAAGAGQQVTLRWKFEPGTVLNYRMTMTNETEMPNNMGVTVMEQVMSNRWEVIEVNADGDATVKTSTDRVQMRMQSPMGNIEIDSASETPASDPTGKMLTAMAGTSYTLVFDASGQVKEVRGIEEMRQRLIDASGQQGNPMVVQMFDQLASEDGIRNMMQQGIAAWPQEPVGPGDTWDAGFEMKIPMLGAMTYAITMTLDRFEERDGATVAMIDTSGSIVMTPSDDPDNPVAGMMEMHATAVTGAMEWDVDRGVLLKTMQDTTMDISIAAGGQQMSMQTFSHMVMELVDAD